MGVRLASGGTDQRCSFSDSRRLATSCTMFLLTDEPLCVGKGALGLLIRTLARSQSTGGSVVLCGLWPHPFPSNCCFPQWRRSAPQRVKRWDSPWHRVPPRTPTPVERASKRSSRRKRPQTARLQGHPGGWARRRGPLTQTRSPSGSREPMHPTVHSGRLRLSTE